MNTRPDNSNTTTSPMKGVVLAGGAGTRLKPLTDHTNKHLLPVADRAMICYPLQTLEKLGVQEALIVTEERWIDDFKQILSGLESNLALNATLAIQTGPGGIVDALIQSEKFAAGAPLAVALGDNIFEYPPEEKARAFTANPTGANVFLTEVSNPEEFGVAVFEDGRIISIIEKPDNPPSNLAVTGLYFYDTTVFERIKKLKPSIRGELEITDLNNLYLNDRQLAAHQIEGWWCDCGTFDSLVRASALLAGHSLEETTR
jgi:glucose-1-phosphate thymidylyltransferase